MAEHSSFWTTNGTGDGSAYTQAQLAAMWKRLFTPSGYGVLFGYANELAVSGTSSPISVATGAAVVQGFMYENDAAKSITVPTPAIGTTGHRVVLRVDWSAQTVRVVLKSSSDGVAALPALTQTINTVYEISLAGLTITTGGVITLTDERTFARYATKLGGNQLETLTQTATIQTSGQSTALRLHNNSTGGKSFLLVSTGAGNPLGAGKFYVLEETTSSLALLVDGDQIKNKNLDPLPALVARKGGSPTDWFAPGNSNYSPSTVKMQIGSVSTGSSATSGSIYLDFPEAFLDNPVVVVSSARSTVIAYVSNTDAIGLTIGWYVRDGGTAVSDARIMWQAIGPA